MTKIPRTNYDNLTMFVAIAAILMVFLIMLMPAAKRIEAAPMLAPTPVANILPSGGSPKVITFIDKQVLTTTTGSTKQALGNIKSMDVQLTIDQTNVNTITVTAQHNNGGTEWADGAVIVSNNTADSTTMSQIANFGAYTRFQVTAANTNAFTITLNANVVMTQ